MIYTSYFAKIKDLPSDMVTISICGKAPDWYDGLQYKKLAPKYDFFMKWKQDHDNNAYIKEFNEKVLYPLNAPEVYYELQNLAGIGKDIVLLCYETPCDFCHRHLVASWFCDYGIECKEIVLGGV